MTTSTHHSFDLVEQQQAFVGLLVHPLLTREIAPDLHRLVSRHRERLAQWNRRLGYRLVAVGPTFRLRRSASPGLPVAVPADERPRRRELVLALVVAAVLEDVRTDTVTIQAISDATRDATAVAGLTAYDPVRRPDRKLLVQAVSRLSEHGVLRRRTRKEVLTGWEDSGTGPGAGYTINRDALLLLVDPSDLSRARAAAVPTDEDQPDTRGQHLLRQLVERQGLLFTDLTPSERDYWRQQRARLIRQAVEMTGGTVEQRAEAAVLVLPTEHTGGREATVDFPKVNGVHWVSLKLLDEGARSRAPDSDGRLHWPSAAVDAAAAALLGELGARLPKALQESPAAIRSAAEATLLPAGLLTVDTAGDWWLSPLAGRYRAASLTVTPRSPEIDTATTILTDEEGGW